MLIELSPVGAMMLYLCLTLATLLGAWGYHHFQSRRKKILVLEQQLYICEYCEFVYLDHYPQRITQCPQCSLYNEHKSTHI